MFFFEKLFQYYHKRVDTALINYINNLPIYDSELVTAMRYSILLGGKRIRPYLVYATGKMFGTSLNDLDAPAAAVECIHAYSLIHDDLPSIDNDIMRRGKLTTHVKFSEAQAILAGDAFQSLAFSILTDSTMPTVSNSNRLAMLSELARASGVAGMCGGQALDLAFEGKIIDLLVLEQIYNCKTGALIRCAIRLGALASGYYGRKVIPLLDLYAQAIGLAFQIQDDIIDVVDDNKKIGKLQGSNQVFKKNTYPYLLGLKQAKNKAQHLYQTAITVLNQIEQDNRIDTKALKDLAIFIIERNY
ncbi:(2E,6E)-farnesyl diphosphate synthase [Candidatus Profftia sp. (ex Adelges kitamiensis)]|uniref:(2E,6E)-farnesyl diphosphate synthase n=1 Tax=Candidatus Profftia sp. (ex Adelges kitamiensis) TaxID=2864218 RepID=UPI001CE35189|nr:(2E,6E)-farnesyl diphosphate synthase [Candidatus Profftia sp. (ex Adelges kitamiensis)]